MKNLNVILTCAGGYGALTLLEDFQRSEAGSKVNFIGPIRIELCLLDHHLKQTI